MSWNLSLTPFIRNCTKNWDRSLHIGLIAMNQRTLKENSLSCKDVLWYALLLLTLSCCSRGYLLYIYRIIRSVIFRTIYKTLWKDSGQEINWWVPPTYGFYPSKLYLDNQFSSVQSLSRVRLFATPWIAARQASLSITISQSSLRLPSIESVMPSSHLILCHPLLLLPPIPPSISLFQWVNSSHEVAKVLELQL